MVEDDDLGVERVASLGGIVLGVTADVTTSNFLDRDVLDVESDVVTWETLDESFVVHFDGLDFRGDVRGGKGDDHAGLDDTGLDTTDWNCSDTANLVDILQGQSERLVGGTDGRLNGVDGFKEGETLGGTSLALLLPTLEPRHVGGLLNHVLIY